MLAKKHISNSNYLSITRINVTTIIQRWRAAQSLLIANARPAIPSILSRVHEGDRKYGTASTADTAHRVEATTAAAIRLPHQAHYTTLLSIHRLSCPHAVLVPVPAKKAMAQPLLPYAEILDRPGCRGTIAIVRTFLIEQAPNILRSTYRSRIGNAIHELSVLSEKLDVSLHRSI